MALWDAHTHLDNEAFDADREAVVERAKDAGVQQFVIAGYAPDRWERTRRVADSLQCPYGLGIHPWAVDSLNPSQIVETLSVLQNTPMSALGELGLDCLRSADEAAWRRQGEVFEAQLHVAITRNLPIILHCVRAHHDMLAIVKRVGLPRAGGMVHAWSGSPELATEFLKLGFYLSFGPLITHTRATRARAAAQQVPLDRLLVETDCPDMPLTKGERGEPVDVLRVVESIAELRGLPVQTVADATGENAARLFDVRTR